MDEEYLYQQIASAIRRDIANGQYQPGDRLPSIRGYAETWHCTLGTVQRALRKLASEGLITTHIGKGTRVVGPLAFTPGDSLRRANLVHRAEAFLLEVLTAGYTPLETEDAFRVALDRWRQVTQSQSNLNQKAIRFAGSHDLAVAWLATHFGEFSPGYQLHLDFSSSMAGLIALAEGKCDLAGTHLWDQTTGTYNVHILPSLFPGEKLALITLAHRRIGLIVKPGNPKMIRTIEDLQRADIRFVNRNTGSGTRVYLDAILNQSNIPNTNIRGYLDQKGTHTEIAAEIAAGHADVGVGLEAAAKAYDLDYVPLHLERYDLVVKAEKFNEPPIQDLIGWLKGPEYHALLDRLGGYEHYESGCIRWI